MVANIAEETVESLSRRVAAGTSLLASEGLIAPFGHPSMRIPETQAFCIISHPYERGRHDMTQTTADDVVVVNFDGDLIKGEKRPPGERFIHSQIYKARPEVQAVVHTHPFACIALSTVGQVVLPIWSHSAIFADAVGSLGYAGQIDTPELGDQVADALGEGRAVFLRGHGIVCVADTVEEACVDSVFLERSAKLQILASVVGDPRAIPHDQLTEESVPKGITKQGYYQSMWEYLTSSM